MHRLPRLSQGFVIQLPPPSPVMRPGTCPQSLSMSRGSILCMHTRMICACAAGRHSGPRPIIIMAWHGHARTEQAALRQAACKAGRVQRRQHLRNAPLAAHARIVSVLRTHSPRSGPQHAPTSKACCRWQSSMHVRAHPCISAQSAISCAVRCSQAFLARPRKKGRQGRVHVYMCFHDVCGVGLDCLP